MSAFSDYVAEQKAFNEQTRAALGNIRGDIQALNDKIAAAGDAPTPEQLAELRADAQAVLDQAVAVDELTPPVIPVSTP